MVNRLRRLAHQRSIDSLAGLLPVAALLITLLVGSAPAEAAAEFVASYKIGLAALERQAWEQAAEHFQNAIEGRDKPAPRLPRHLYFHDYLPHYHLGLARFHQGNCLQAFAAWEASERHGLIFKRKEHEDLVRYRATCEERRATLEKEIPATAEKLDKAAEHLRQSVAKDPKYSAAWTLLGQALADAGHKDEAIKAYEDGIQVAEEKGDKQAAKEMAVFLKRLKKRAKDCGVRDKRVSDPFEKH